MAEVTDGALDWPCYVRQFKFIVHRISDASDGYRRTPMIGSTHQRQGPQGHPGLGGRCGPGESSAPMRASDPSGDHWRLVSSTKKLVWSELSSVPVKFTVADAPGATLTP
jgi:hypothetical protein